MIVLRITVVVFVNFTIVCSSNFSDQSGFFKRADGSVNGGSTDSPSIDGLVQSGDDFIDVEVFVVRKYLTNDDVPFLCQSHVSSRQELGEFLNRRSGDFFWGKITHV